MEFEIFYINKFPRIIILEEIIFPEIIKLEIDFLEPEVYSLETIITLFKNLENSYFTELQDLRKRQIYKELKIELITKIERIE